MRLFIGIEVPQSQKLLEIFEIVKNTGADIKLVEPYNIHITLLFLGEVRDDRLEEVKDSMREVKFNKFRVTLKGLGAFPNLTRPRVVWVGITEGQQQLKQIRSYILNEILKRKIKPEDDKDFSPHLTIGRVKSYNSISNLINAINENMNVDIGTFEVSNVVLFKSTLTPKGPIYDRLFEVSSIDRGGSAKDNKTY
ncbi:RNA 2',3'-cyclic phosphodiesterase [Sulfolobus sp. E5-1-F]|uniref:RNA 2',3'-cyclic phosphodiesterase n=1 Tax=Sulfolobaceae TaxID=118883 RepID=UPI001294F922|nr:MULTISPECIES: RNA 2',3'-cyclic phosphodiesterase [unclassified Sulfolobus]QGA54290.1 RNA 2',3'-cyclic phosphodiesterase [Sulfolobus sp. E5-1-F]QGA69344.1 RNA 2',3'-cyclic phosphodiesterase [Sulfolobus sp. E11-6]